MELIRGGPRRGSKGEGGERKVFSTGRGKEELKGGKRRSKKTWKGQLSVDNEATRTRGKSHLNGRKEVKNKISNLGEIR